MTIIIDEIARLFPIEKNLVRGTDLDVNFLGHCFMADSDKLLVPDNQRRSILLLPGRRGAIGRKMFPALSDKFKKISTLGRNARPLWSRPMK
jgi:lipid A disaccharide synthetase